MAVKPSPIAQRVAVRRPRPRRTLRLLTQHVDAGGNLPRELTSFVGRQEQLATIARLLPSVPLLTLVGVGGIGKTRLAARAAMAAHERYAHGVWLVELAPIGDPEGVATEVARALSVRERPGWSALETLRAVLRN